MALVAGKPFLEWLLLQLRAAGVERFIFCTGYLHEQVQAHFANGENWSVEITYSREHVALGTGGALRQALPIVRGNRFIALNGDSYCSFDMALLSRKHAERRARITLWLATVDDCSRFGSVQVGDDGKVLQFIEKSGAVGKGLINAGIYLFERDAIEALPLGEARSLEKDLFPHLINHDLYGVVGAGPFLDIGTPESYARATAFMTALENEPVHRSSNDD